MRAAALLPTTLVTLLLASACQPEPAPASGDSDTAVDTDSGADSDTAVDTDTAPDPDTAVDTDSGADTDTAVDTDSGADTAVDTDSGADTDTAVDTDSGADTDTAVDTETDTGVATDTAVDTASDTETDTGVATDTAVDTDTGVDTDTAVDTDTGVATDTAVDTATDTAVDTATDTAVDTAADTAVDTDTGVATDTAVDTATDTTVDTATDTTTDTAPVDLDGDGYTVPDGDCDDTRADVHPGAPEICGDGLDNDCSGDASGCAPSSADASTLVTYLGELAGDNAGYSVAGGGDVNGDGYADIAIGAPFNTEGGSESGAVYLVLGSASPTSASLSTAIEYSGVVESGVGASVTRAGDVNADGYDDLVLGAERFSVHTSRFYDAAATLVLGGPSPASTDVSAFLPYAISLSTDGWGLRVGYGGDLNADGYTELLAFTYDYDGTPTGAYIIPGSASPSVRNLEDGVAYVELASRGAGLSASGLDDFDGDGFGDLVIGAMANDNYGDTPGFAYFVPGAETLSPSPLADAVCWRGDDLHDYVGMSTAAAGDVNADGYADALVGASYRNYHGAAILVLGGPAPASGNIWDNAHYDASDTALAGFSVDGAGDVDADGFQDLLIGAPRVDGAGCTYLVYGSASPSSASLDTAVAWCGSSGSNTGYAVARAGDVNADGVDDLLFGAPYAADAGTDAGVAYLAFGGAP